MSNILKQLLLKKNYLFADGATGTNFFPMGLKIGDAPELWNTEYPECVAANYRHFIDAGSDILLTNSFGGNRYKLKHHQSADRVAELNERAVIIAREEVKKTHNCVLVAGSIGPTGEILAPLGKISIEEATDAFTEQALALARGGADLLWIETLSSLDEMKAALDAAAKTGLPIVCTMSFDTNGRSMMGVTPGDLVRFAADTECQPDAIGANCGVGPSELVASVLKMSELSKDGAIIVAKGNCGIPQYIDGSIQYDGSLEMMAAYARMAVNAGASIIGGCCGTTPAHVAAMRTSLNGYSPGSRPSMDHIVEVLGDVSTGARAQYRGDDSLLAGSATGAKQRNRRRSRS